jgi:hypothetical protein
MKLIWTYDSEVWVSFVSNMDKGYVANRKMILLNYYIHSITKAKEFGYYTIIYCNDLSAKYFEGLTDEVIVIGKYENTLLWDGIKIHPLEFRNDEYCLIDGDIILNERLPEFRKDIVFDVYEAGNWEIDYKETVLKLDSMGIGDTIPEWNPKKTLIACCGFMSLQNKEFKDLYVNRWKTFNNFISEHSESLNTSQATNVVSQMLFTLLIKHYGYEFDTMSKHMGDSSNRYYTHFYGGKKFKTPITKYNSYILEKENNKQNLI